MTSERPTQEDLRASAGPNTLLPVNERTYLHPLIFYLAASFHQTHTMRDIMLIIHFIGLAMGIGTSFAFMFLGIAAAKLAPEDRLKFALQTFSVSRMGHIGLTLLILSGGYLMTPYWRSLSNVPLLIAKLVLVVILAILIGIISVNMRKALAGNAEAHLKKIGTLGRLTMIVGLAIVILAVCVFH